MCKYLLDHRGIFDTGDYLDGTTAFFASCYIDIEHSLEALCLYALGCKSSRRDDLRVCCHLFYYFSGVCYPCRGLPVSPELKESPIVQGSVKTQKNKISHGDTLALDLDLTSSAQLTNCLLRITIYDFAGVVIGEWHSQRLGRIISLDEGHNSIKIEMGPLHLRKGAYRLGVTLNGPNGVQEITVLTKRLALKFREIWWVLMLIKSLKLSCLKKRNHQKSKRLKSAESAEFL